jgi:hypothetical protein
LIGLSPLTTAHPSGFQPTTVRPSTRHYPRFSLAMARSLWFRVLPQQLNARLRLAFASAPPLNGLTSLLRTNSPDHNAKGTRSPEHPPEGRVELPPLVGTRFQVLFHPPPGVLFTFPSRYLCTIGHGLVFSLGRWSCRFRSGFLVSRRTQERFRAHVIGFAYGAVTLFGLAFQTDSTHRHAHTESRQTLTNRPTTPYKQRLPPWHLYGLGSSPFARRY